jgi:hypothetical protein
MSSFEAIARLDLESGILYKLPVAEQVRIRRTWVHPVNEAALIERVCALFQVAPTEFRLLSNSSKPHPAYAVQYLNMPFPDRVRTWVKGVYRDVPHPNFLAAAVGALAGAALAVTFHNLQPAVVEAALYNGVNDCSLLPYFVETGVCAITGSCSASDLKLLRAGETPPEFETRFLQPLDHVFFNGTELLFINLPEALPIADHCAMVCWRLIDAVCALPPELRAQLPDVTSFQGVTAKKVSDTARQGGPDAMARTAFSAAMLGWHHGPAALPSQWCQRLVPGHPRVSISLYRLVTTIQKRLAVLSP